MSSTMDLGPYHEIELPQAALRYRDVGVGPPIVFVHGILANGTLWRDVVPRLAGEFRCVVPDLPLGGHTVPLPPDADRGPDDVAQLLANLIAALDLHDVTLVGNDTGGAICQITIARHPERIGRLVLTNCDAYEAFFPLVLRPLQYGARVAGAWSVHALAWMLRPRFAQRILLWTVAKRRPDTATLDAYLGPLLGDAAVRRDLAGFLARVSNRYTLEAAQSFPSFLHPVLIAWGEDDLFFSKRLAHRLQRDFPNARLELIPHARAFVPEDQPQRLAELIAAFMRTPPSGTAATPAPSATAAPAATHG